MLRTLSLLALLALHAAASWAGGEAELGRRLAATCTGCHGTNGRALGGMAPLAGMPEAALVRAMQEFRSGARPATVMGQLARGYTDEQIRLIARHFAAQAERD